MGLPRFVLPLELKSKCFDLTLLGAQLPELHPTPSAIDGRNQDGCEREHTNDGNPFVFRR